MGWRGNTVHGWGLLRALLLWIALVCGAVACAEATPIAARIEAADATCRPELLRVEAARGEGLSHRQAPFTGMANPPASGWEQVGQEDRWLTRWPQHNGAVWYRFVWDLHCASEYALAQREPLALFLSSINMAGAIYLNGHLFWRDESLVEPLSRSWLRPRYWSLSPVLLKPRENEVLLQVVGHASQLAGPGRLLIGDLKELQPRGDAAHLSLRTGLLANALLSATLGVLFFMVWCMRRKEVAYGWYALLSLCWVVYLGTVLAVRPWPWADSISFTRFSLMSLGLYCATYCVFTWRFGEQRLPRIERAMWTLVGLSVAVIWLTPLEHIQLVFAVIWVSYVLLFQVNCLQFQFHAWRRRTPELMLLAACWLMFLAVSLHDLWQLQDGSERLPMLLTPFSALLASVFMSVLLAFRLASTMRRIEGFNTELEAHVTQARLELAQTLRREHDQALENVKLQERIQLSHDLHDGLGGSLVRAMALVEQTPGSLPSQRVMSLFKVLRDDLRQVIDHGSSSSVEVPETPVVWLAPLRHRFTRLFEDMDIDIVWSVPEQWLAMPSALQCLGMTRVLEEALSNVIKHSRATHVQVRCEQTEPKWLVVEVVDNGVGFDVAAVQGAGLSVGMRSMAARAERMQGRLQVTSGTEGTRLRLAVLLPGSWDRAPGAVG